MHKSIGLFSEHYPRFGYSIILSGYRGSVAHGTYVPQDNPTSIDDKDVMHICVPSLDFYFGFTAFGAHETIEIKHDEWDIVAYEARKFIRLLDNGNPNVLSMLWLRPEHYILKTPAGQLLIDNRKLFVSKHVYKSFTGYAYGQLHRMTHMAFEGYMGDKRRKLVEQFGYDTKNASHLIRLLRQSIEFLTTGELIVTRPDSHQLLEIKRGEWSLQRVKDEADRLFKLAEEAYVRSSLPATTDFTAINKLAVDVITAHLEIT